MKNNASFDNYSGGCETMKKFIRMAALATVLALLSSINVYAGNVEGTVVDIVFRASDGLVYFNIIGQSHDKPTCATSSYWMIKNEQSNAAKLQIAALLLAYASGKTVTVYGTNTCTRWPDGEDVDWIRVQ